MVSVASGQTSMAAAYWPAAETVLVLSPPMTNAQSLETTMADVYPVAAAFSVSRSSVTHEAPPCGITSRCAPFVEMPWTFASPVSVTTPVAVL